MKLEEKIQLFLDGKAILHTPTKEIFDSLMEFLENRGVLWHGGDKPTHSESIWFDEKEDSAVMMGAVEDGGIRLEMTYDFKENFMIDYPHIVIFTLTNEDKTMLVKLPTYQLEKELNTNELIKIDKNNKVSGRELHDFLEVETRYNDWIMRMCEYGFSEGEDFNLLKNEQVQIEGNRTVKRMVDDAVMTIEMAKEICMIQRTEKGKQARQYFLACERRLKQIAAPQDSYMISDPVERAKKWIEEEQVRQQQAKQLEAAKPKIIFSDAVASATNDVLVRDLAKVLHQNGVDIGQNRMFAWLRENGYLIKSGSDKNMPTQKSMEMGLFRIKEGTRIDSAGNNVTTKTTKVTGKGQIYFVNKFLA